MTRRAKYYIDYENEWRECSDCRKVMPFNMFNIEWRTALLTPKSYCKKCSNERARKAGRAKSKKVVVNEKNSA